ncbi:23S rRNA (uracil1939-C5)-methyltransferase [Sarcina sp. DSM 11001]|uniref:23S rRNA (uracil(1939)-C(5))-methyltransferase RlmD n=1 Tax=Sarcina sp. DSM 11001 TaxID=1798184 RepID=UPI00088838F2|nr:23S rRNA (uracil(1939)-C(5))-methyltransferase RlmD [Sarcina sp. DSM 11001]SDL43633.1 23S rRNA (uracil1939-C5)-methyltransferase [Sarcina sp. DSM 11001]
MRRGTNRKKQKNQASVKNLPCKKNDRAVIRIEDIGSGGEGIGFLKIPEVTQDCDTDRGADTERNDTGRKIEAEIEKKKSLKKGFAIFVKDAVPGDTIEVTVTKVTTRYAYGHLDRILEPSPSRVEPRCPIAKTCGGCQIQALDYAKQLAFKQKKVRENLIRIGSFAPEEIDAVLHPIVGMEEPWHYRNKEQVPVQQGKYGPVTGFYASHSHTVIPMTDCLIGSPKNKQILETVLSWMQAYNVPAYDEETGKGLIRHILIRDGIYSGQVMVCVIANDYRLPFEKELVEALRCLEGVSSIVLNTNTESTNVITGRALRTLWGANDIVDTLHIHEVIQKQVNGDTYTSKDSNIQNGTVFKKTEESVTFGISPLSFYQVNPRQTEKLYSLALTCAGLTGNETVWDLYCGVGTISLFMARHAKQVYGVEIIPEAIENARMNAERNGIENATFYVGKAEEVLPDYVENLKAQGKDPQIDVICVDPPRKGCDDVCIRTMLEIAPKRIVYVSCDPATLARDLKKLTEGGYRLDYVQPVDQFAHTVHVETVCLLSKLNGTHQHIEVTVDMDEMDLTAAESKATYDEIRDWVQENYGFHVTNLNIAQVKRKHGIDLRENYNKPKSPDSRQPGCPEKKVRAIEAALERFQMI